MHKIDILPFMNEGEDVKDLSLNSDDLVILIILCFKDQPDFSSVDLASSLSTDKLAAAFRFL